MNAEELRCLQAPLKQMYRDEPRAAWVTLKAAGNLGEGLTCKVQTGRAVVEAGLHPKTGGSGLRVCSGDMLLEALVGLRWRHAQRGGHGDRRARARGSDPRGRRFGFSRHPRRREGDAGRVPSGPALLRFGNRREFRAVKYLDPPDRALLRRLPDAFAFTGNHRHAEHN
jgi:hypothetical protein